MSFESPLSKRYEEFAYVLVFFEEGKSTVIRGREGNIIHAIGEDRLTLLELLANNNVTFNLGERVNIGKSGRNKIVSVLGKLSYEELDDDAKNDLPSVIENIIMANEKKYVDYFNNLQPVTPRLHALELIPGIGKTLMLQILGEREKKPFANFEEVCNRVSIKEPIKLLAKRMIEEISGDSRINLFVRG